MQTVILNNDIEMPIAGFGVYQIPEDQTEDAVEAALNVGYRRLDTPRPGDGQLARRT